MDIKPSPREQWLEERCAYLEKCIHALGFKTDPESFYALRHEREVDQLKPVESVDSSIIRLPWAVKVDASADVSGFGWEVRARTRRTEDMESYGMAVYVEPLRYGEKQLAAYAEYMLEKMMRQLMMHYWGKTTK